jgi:pimeloyl-ACP methyl ester carboxylesterase
MAIFMNKPLVCRVLLALLVAALVNACASTTHQNPRTRGALVSVETVQRFSRESIDKANRHLALSGEALCDVKVVQLTYESIGVKGEPEVLSAGMYVPENCPHPYPLLAQAHGTQVERRRGATDVGPRDRAITFFAARGYLVVTADYLGLGKSDYPYHPYLHADSEASAIIDAIRAGKAAAQRLNVPLDGKVMLFGYSQGGHAAMAAQREIERSHRGEINLVASAPMAGPYNLTQTFLGSWFGQTAGDRNALASELFSYAVVSYNRVYGTLYAKPNQLFSEPYANIVESLFPGSLSLNEINKQKLLPAGHHLNDLRNPRFTAEFLLDEKQPLRVALKKNDLLDWAPQVPTVLCGSRRDAIVDFQNAYAAQAAFRAKGVDVPVIDVADEIPSSENGASHHGYEFPCYAKVRTQLFDPIVQGDKSPEPVRRARIGSE